MDEVGCCPVGCRSAVLGEGSRSAYGGEREQVCSLPYVNCCGVTDDEDARRCCV
jgi:hypothetical protein